MLKIEKIYITDWRGFGVLGTTKAAAPVATRNDG